MIRVVTVASFGNGSLSLSAHADEPPKFRTDLGVNEKKTAINDRKIASDSVLICVGTLDELGHGSSSFLN